MSIQITTAFVKQYAAGIRILQQQMDSRLRAAVSVENNIEGDRAFFDQVDATAMSEVTNRHGTTEYTDTPHARRMLTLKTYDVADLVDRADQRRLLNDPVNSYSRSMAMAANRQIDDTILAKFDATANTEVDGSGTAAHPATHQFTEASNTNFGSADLITARSILEEYENMEDDGDYSWHVACSSNQRANLLGDGNLTSADTNTVRVLVNGGINTFMGYDFIKTERAPKSGDDRDVYFWVKSSMKLGIGIEPRAFIDVLPERRHSLQVRYETDIGATRMDEKGVVRCIADEG